MHYFGSSKADWGAPDAIPREVIVVVVIVFKGETGDAIGHDGDVTVVTLIGRR